MKRMPSFHIHEHPQILRCPYSGCGKEFDRPTILIDSSTITRQTYYACPHCMSKLRITVDDFRVVDIKPMEYGKVFESPAKCAHYSGLMGKISKDMPIPDDCLICPKILQCKIREH